MGKPESTGVSARTTTFSQWARRLLGLLVLVSVVVGAPASAGAATPTSPTITNLPLSNAYGDSFTPIVDTTGDGTTSVTSSTTDVCSVDPASGVVSYVGVGTCVLEAHVTAGSIYDAADGSPLTFTIGRATPSRPTIDNLPASGVYAMTFSPVVSTTGDGATSVTTTTSHVCSVDLSTGLVSFIGIGTCNLVPHVAIGTDYARRNGATQHIVVPRLSPTTPTISNLPDDPSVSGTFVPVVATTGDGTIKVSSATGATCQVSSLTGVVTFARTGTCTLLARVTAGSHYGRGLGNPQSFTITR